MLVLSRAVNESVIIDDDVEIFVTAISPERVDLVVLGLPTERYKTLLLRKNQTATVLDVEVVLVCTSVDKARFGFTAPFGETGRVKRGQLPRWPM